MGRSQTFAVGWNIYIYTHTYQIYAILYVQDCLHAFIPLSIGLMTWETILPLTAAAMLAFRPLARSSQRTKCTYNGTVLSRAFRRKVGKSESDSFRRWCSGPRSWLCRTAVRCYDVWTIAPLLTLLWGPLQLSFWRYIRSFPVYLFEYVFSLQEEVLTWTTCYCTIWVCFNTVIIWLECQSSNPFAPTPSNRHWLPSFWGSMSMWVSQVTQILVANARHFFHDMLHHS